MYTALKAEIHIGIAVAGPLRHHCLDVGGYGFQLQARNESRKAAGVGANIAQDRIRAGTWLSFGVTMLTALMPLVSLLSTTAIVLNSA